MSTLEDVVQKTYGNQLMQGINQGNPHYLFTLYENPHTHEQYFLRTMDLPTFLYISEATTEVISGKYHTLLPKFQIIPIDRTFQAYTYLIRSPINIIPLSAFLQIKKDCREVLDIDFFLRFLEFAKNSFKIVESNSLPLFSIGQIGLTEAGEFVLCDPSFYFSGHNVSTIEKHFGPWIATFVREVLNLPINKVEQEQVLKQCFGQYLTSIRPFFDYLMSEQATLEITQSKLATTISRFSEDVSTVTGSFVEINQLVERANQESRLQHKTKFRKIGLLAKIIIIFVVIGILVGVGFFFFNFFRRSFQCPEGNYQIDNQCVSCSSGCIRCENSEPNTCTKCDLNMYLVIESEQDKKGFCLSQCSGRLITVDICVREKQIFQSPSYVILHDFPDTLPKEERQLSTEAQ